VTHGRDFAKRRDRFRRADPGRYRQSCTTLRVVPNSGMFVPRGAKAGRDTDRLCDTGHMSVIFLSGPIGAGKTAVAQELLQLLPAPLSYIEGDTFWSFIKKGGESELRDNFPVLVRSMTAAAVPFARSGFRVLIDFSIPPAYLETARKILKEVPFDFVLLRPGGIRIQVHQRARREPLRAVSGAAGSGQ